MENPKKSVSILADKALLDVLASNEKTQFSTSALQLIMNILAKVSIPSYLDHGILGNIFECLQSWSSSKAVSPVLPFLANVFDNLLHRDLNQREVSDSISKLLFLIEDMADHPDCKILAGKHFLQRLLALAGSKLTGVKLQRAAVETLSSLIVLSPRNQEIVTEYLCSEWSKLVKQVLPQCGDFFVQASIVEIFYRLSKRSSKLLDLLEDENLRKKMQSLHQTRKIDLLAETRAFLDLLNRSLGNLRSVYSFLAEDIIFDGQRTPLKDEKWVHFGTDHMSCYAPLDSESVSGSASLVDVAYIRVCDLQVCSNVSFEMTFRDSLQDTWNRSRRIKVKIFLKSEEVIAVMDYILPRISHIQGFSQKGACKGGNSENTSTTLSASAKAEINFRKSSMGFTIPLPRKFKLPCRKSSDHKACKAELSIAEKKIEHVVQEVAKCVLVSGNLHNQVLPVSGNLQNQACQKNEDRTVCEGVAFSFSPTNGIDHAVIEQCEPNPFTVRQREPCSMPIDANGEPVNPKKDDPTYQQAANSRAVSPACHSRAEKVSSICQAEKTDDQLPVHLRKDGVSDLISDSDHPIKLGFLNYTSRKSIRKTGSSILNGNNACRSASKPAVRLDNVPELENAGKASTIHVKEIVEHFPHLETSPKGEKVALNLVNCNVSDKRQDEELPEKILHILTTADLPQSNADDKEKQRKSISDPIETDSEYNRSVSDNMKRGNLKSGKSSFAKKDDNFSVGQEAGVATRRYKRKSTLKVGKDETTLGLKRSNERDVYSFEEHEQCKPPKETEGKNPRISNSKSKAEHQLADILEETKQGTAAEDVEGKMSKTRVCFSRANGGSPGASEQDQSCRAAKDITGKDLKLSKSKGKVSDRFTNLCTKDSRGQHCVIGNSKRNEDGGFVGHLEKDPNSLVAKDIEDTHLKFGNDETVDHLEDQPCTAKGRESKHFKLGNNSQSRHDHCLDLSGGEEQFTAAAATGHKHVEASNNLDDYMAFLSGTEPGNITKFSDRPTDYLTRFKRRYPSRHKIDTKPAKRMKLLPEMAEVEPENADKVLNQISSIESPKPGALSDDKDENDLFITRSSSEQTQNGDDFAIIDTKKPKRSLKGTFFLEAVPPSHRTRRRAREIHSRPNERLHNPFNFIESTRNDDTLASECDTMTNGEMHLLAALVEKIMKKIKIKTDNKAAQILSDSMALVENRCKEVQGQIQSDLAECTKLCGQAYGDLQVRLQEEHEAFKSTQKMWKDEFNNHLLRFNEVSSQIESSNNHLKGVSDKQKVAHRKLFLNLNEFVEGHLTETEQKLLALQKASKGLRNELKGALLEIL